MISSQYIKDNRASTWTHLDSHANIFCVGQNAFIVDDHTGVVTVNGYSPAILAVQYRIVDATLLYECPYSLKKVILLAQGALHVPAMTHNLVSPFILREAGVDVK